MKVLLLTGSEGAPGGTGIDHCARDKLLQCARVDRFGVHSLTDDPQEADVILFAEMGFSAALGPFDARLRAHPLVRRFRDKCFVYNSADIAIPFLPGVYPSIERGFYDDRRVRSGHYLSTHTARPPFVDLPHSQRDLLFSFVGNAGNHPVRRRIVELRHSRGVSADVAGGAWGSGREAVTRFVAEYADVMSRSRFALCPRGLGTSSIRLFESMQSGTVPVIVSDDWVEPAGPDWSAFSVRIAEADVDRIPMVLESLEERSGEMGGRARAAWEDWFSDEVSFHRVIEWCAEIVATRGHGGDPALARGRAYLQVLRPRHARMAAREAKGAFARLAGGGRGR